MTSAADAMSLLVPFFPSSNTYSRCMSGPLGDTTAARWKSGVQTCMITGCMPATAGLDQSVHGGCEWSGRCGAWLESAAPQMQSSSATGMVCPARRIRCIQGWASSVKKHCLLQWHVGCDARLCIAEYSVADCSQGNDPWILRIEADWKWIGGGLQRTANVRL
jgi:hypothetical protein